MLFNSYEFILVFLPVTIVVFFWIGATSQRAAQAFLLLASFLFYAWWSFEYGLLILATILVNYAFGLKIQELAERGDTRAKPLLATAIAANLGVLCYYKYRNFFIENWNAATGSSWELAPLILPLAISFHTFQQIAYLVDSHRCRVQQPSLPQYALFVLFFPQLIAGPIVHHYQLLPQLNDSRIFRFDSRSLAMGLSFFVFGLAKKLLIADQLALVADPIFDSAATQPPALSEAWVGLGAYTLGLYFDFSAYSDMAVGLARMFGIRLPYNFSSPYKAMSIIDFWRRWHITLSNWLRDYLYVPLGGNRHGKVRRYVNLLITMLLGGLWHGAAWHFVFWGLLHGLYLIVNHAWRALQQKVAIGGRSLELPRPAAWLLTFAAVSFAWIFFRSATAEHALAMTEGLVGLHGWHSGRLASIADPVKLVLLALAFAVAVLMPNTQDMIDGDGGRLPSAARGVRLAWHPTMRWAATIAGLLFISLTQMSTSREFVYFQF